MRNRNWATAPTGAVTRYLPRRLSQANRTAGLTVAWPTFGPQSIRTQQYTTVADGTSFTQLTVRSCGNRPASRTLITMRSGFKAWQAHHPSLPAETMIVVSGVRWVVPMAVQTAYLVASSHQEADGLEGAVAFSRPAACWRLHLP